VVQDDDEMLATSIEQITQLKNFSLEAYVVVLVKVWLPRFVKTMDHGMLCFVATLL
jgi:hypothetical protein